MFMLNFYRNFIFLTLISSVLSACNNGSSTGKNQSVDISTIDTLPSNLGQLPNGSEVVVSSAVFTTQAGSTASITGSLTLLGGSDVVSYSALFTTSPSTSSPNIASNCSSLSTKNPSCQILINSQTAESGTYTITTNLSASNGSSSTTVNPFYIVVLPPTGVYIDSGNISVTLESNSIPESSSSMALVILSGSYGVNNVTTAISVSNSEYATVIPDTCNLSSDSNVCTVNITGVKSSSDNPVTLNVIADGYSTITSPQFFIVNNSIISNWLEITGGTGQPQYAKTYGSPTPESIVMMDQTGYLWTYNNGNWMQITNSSDTPQPSSKYGMHEFASPTPTNIFMNDYNNILWVFDGNSWTQMTGVNSNTPKMVSDVYGSPTPTSFVTIDTSGNLWTYNNGIWINQTPGDSNHPTNITHVPGSPTPTSIIAQSTLDTGGNQLWTYDGNSWMPQIGEIGPTSLSTVYDSPTLSSIVISDRNNFIWTYDGNSWTQITNDSPGQPDSSQIYHVYTATTNCIILTDSNNQLWVFDGKQWAKLTGGNGPINISDVYALPTTTSIVVTDNASITSIWSYSNGIWKQINGAAYGPSSVAEFYGEVTTDSIILSGSSDTGSNVMNSLWTFDGTQWIQQTNLNGAPLSYKIVIAPLPSISSINIIDSGNQLWNYNGYSWTMQTGTFGAPTSIKSIIGAPEANSLVAIDSTNQIWIMNAN